MFYKLSDENEKTDDKMNFVVNEDGVRICMVRTYSSGVFYGAILCRKGKECTLKNARRVWMWDGAASLSELAMHGTSKPDSCKFPCEVKEVTLTEVIEIVPMTEQAIISLNTIPIWTAQKSIS